MLPVGDRPLLERTIEQLRAAGIREVHLTTHYLPDSIVEHFGDGEAFGVSISYANEDEPLGTAGGLRLIPRPTGPFLVINGDILTGVSYQQMLRFHRKHGATADGGRSRPRDRGALRGGGVRRRPRHGADREAVAHASSSTPASTCSSPAPATTSRTAGAST